jgi:hypothetical protein
MKIKRIGKKLALNKRTVLHLTSDKMDEIKGGISKTCISLFPPVCTIGCPASRDAMTACVWCVP